MGQYTVMTKENRENITSVGTELLYVAVGVDRTLSYIATNHGWIVGTEQAINHTDSGNSSYIF